MPPAPENAVYVRPSRIALRADIISFSLSLAFSRSRSPSPLSRVRSLTLSLDLSLSLSCWRLHPFLDATSRSLSALHVLSPSLSSTCEHARVRAHTHSIQELYTAI